MNKKTQFLLWLRTQSTFVDLMFIASISYLFNILIIRFVDISFLSIFLVLLPTYYGLCYWFFEGRTPAKILTGLQVVSKKKDSINIKQILVRELGKILTVFIIPIYLINKISFPISIVLLWVSIGYLLYLIIIFTGLPLLLKKTWWDLISSTTIIKSFAKGKNWRVRSIIAMISIFAITILFKLYPFINNVQTIRTKFHPEYSNSHALKTYKDYILSNSQDPVEYIFDLFDKYDLVVLCERAHPEYTQYELISSIVTDKRFSDKIGNIYTECGTRNFQDTLNKYLKNNYQNKDSLNKATAYIQMNSNSVWPLWTNTNLFDLLKTANKHNQSLPDSLKINWYFTDVATNWETMTPKNYRNHKRQVRDKGMADYIVSKYKNKQSNNEIRNKGLVIMNFRHGFGRMYNKETKPADVYPKSVNATEILMDSLPDKVCNVLLNTISLKYGYLFTPIQKGKWDKTFDELNNPNIGFDFVDSPFGLDEFDMNIGKQANELRYQDVFNGFIFYKPLSEHLYKRGFPYMLDNFEDTLIRRAECVSSEYADEWREQIKNYKSNNIKNRFVNMPELINLCNGEASYASLYNFIINIGFSIVVLFALIIVLVNFNIKTD